MKLSRRGKQARRGRHTKRTGKHHTRRIKHRGKQYKKTYRKNKKRIRCRSLRGGLTASIMSNPWTAPVAIPVNNVMLRYKKQAWVTKAVTDDYAVTVQKEVKPNDLELPIKYMITLRRITRKPYIQFVINIIPFNTMQFAIESYDTQKNAYPKIAAATEAAAAAAEKAAEKSWDDAAERQLRAEQDRKAQAAAAQDNSVTNTTKMDFNYVGGSNDNEQSRIEFRIDYDGKTPDEKFDTSAHTDSSNGNILAFVYASLFNIQSDRGEGYDFDNDDKYKDFMKKILEAIVRDGPSSFKYDSEGNPTFIKTTRDYDNPEPYTLERRHTISGPSAVEQPQQPQPTRTTV
jgi:hypothetical protein